MRRVGAIFVLCTGLLTAACPGAPKIDSSEARFEALDIFLESEGPVAAWQFELGESSGQMRVVGVENGDSAAFDDAPYYDLDAVSEGQADRIIVADYSLSPAVELPSGRTRIATVHVQLRGSRNPDYVLRLTAAGGEHGKPIVARIELDTA